MAAFYHGYIRQLVVAFNALFGNIHVVRRTGDSVAGRPTKDIRVPIAFSNRAKWLEQIRENTRAKQVKIELPRIGFEITSFAYDSTRKKNRNQTVQCTDEYGNTVVVSNPVPWNVELAMYIVGDNQEDCLQIVEQILPKFNPDLTIAFTNVMSISTNVPLTLQSVSCQDDYEGVATDDRLVIYTLTFIAKLELYGEVIDVGQLKPPVINDPENGDQTSGAVDEDGNPCLVQGAPNINITVGKTGQHHKDDSPAVYIVDQHGNTHYRV